MAEGQLDMAKAQAEVAKAKQLQGQADMLDLDFVEQESGVKELRELRKQGEQARANMAMKEREAQLKNQGNMLNTLMRNRNI